MLLTMEETADALAKLMPSPERIYKVEESMDNIETVIKERNRAYMQLEVNEKETGMVPKVFRRDTYGVYRWVMCSDHLIPYRMNTKWRNLWGPGRGKEIEEFMRKFKEIKAEKAFRRRMERCFEVRQYLRRFPDIDLDYLQELYPDVPVNYFKENLHRYPERRLLIRLKDRKTLSYLPSD